MNHLEILQNKIQPREALASIIASWRLTGQRIVFTNGCFDILHYGHISYLARARDLGDRLILGLNSDSSVSKLKGPERPVNKEHARAMMLASLHVVDAITVFDEDTPLELLRLFKPDVLVKGGDYTVDTVVGADLILNNGGKVELLPFEEGFSTTSLIQKMKNGKE
ncbi:MAG: D-glycero-beta-D-manno-heptose 1-phosphate adenylyltransferase [Bacteroidota bacterium]|nr:D-glycero-beta-D-manno-heptose 1-phosphate adenylyltransferase [Bacteroidota bacterium]MDX5448088.1 D-glycero-beta-D-manno-heptose 1-phosphate adenylyltransferase [Bacteroidota bacterium]